MSSKGRRPGRANPAGNSFDNALINDYPRSLYGFESSLSGGNSYLSHQHVDGFSYSHDTGHTHMSFSQNSPTQHHQSTSHFQSQPQHSADGRLKESNTDDMAISDHQVDFSWSSFLHDSALNTAAISSDSNRDGSGNGDHDGYIIGARYDQVGDGVLVRDCPSRASSCGSRCEGSCPSECGDVGPVVCCDDDECDAGPDLCIDDECVVGPDLCIDDSCHAAVVPCTDESCSATTLPTLPAPSTALRAITDSDKAAAAALASFGGDSLQSMQAGFTQSSLMGPQSARNGSLDYMGLENASCGDFQIDPMFTNMMDFSNQSSMEQAFQYALAAHLLQYHDPMQSHTEFRPCAADNISKFGSKCLLPKCNYDGEMEGDAFAAPHQHNECGFQVHDPSDFTHHIFEEHRAALLPQTHQFMPHNDSFGLACAHVPGGFPLAPYPMNMNMGPPRPFSSASTPTNLSSVQPSLSTTPTSPLGSDQIQTDPSTARTESPPALLRKQTFDHDDQYVCRWRTGNGDEICGQSFTSDDALHSHCKTYHLKLMKKSPDGFACLWELCGREKLFSQRSKLERHLQVHTGFKPVQCEICGASLSAKQSLDQHMRIHTGTKPWECSFPGCGLTFKQQSALTMHERTHTGEKPLECEICGKRFSESSNLSKHRRIHNVKGMHECDVCGKDFHRLDQLRRHIGTKHKDKSDKVDELLAKAKARSQGAARITKSQRARSSVIPAKRNPDTVEMMGEQMELML